MKHTLKYIFSFCLVFSVFLAQAQDLSQKGEPAKQTTTVKNPSDDLRFMGAIPETPKPATKPLSTDKKSDSIPVKKDRYGVRVGVDLFKLTRGLYDHDYKGIELVGDYRLSKKIYLAAEVGTEDKTTDDDLLNFTTKGSYLKMGFDYNAYQNWLDMENIISVGLRYGFSTFNQTLNHYDVYNTNPYFGEAPAVISGETFDGLTAHWVSVVTGVKAKVFNNVFVGFSLQLNGLIYNTKPTNFDNLYIPGFNRTYDGNFGVGFNYTVSYFIPIYKKRLSQVVKKFQSNEK